MAERSETRDRQMHSVVSQVGGLGQRGKGGPLEGQGRLAQPLGPWATSKGPAQPLASLLASSGGSDETPSAFYFHKVFFLGEEASTLWKQRTAPHCGPRPEINLFLALTFWFINM